MLKLLNRLKLIVSSQQNRPNRTAFNRSARWRYGSLCVIGFLSLRDFCFGCLYEAINLPIFFILLFLLAISMFFYFAISQHMAWSSTLFFSRSYWLAHWKQVHRWYFLSQRLVLLLQLFHYQHDQLNWFLIALAVDFVHLNDLLAHLLRKESELDDLLGKILHMLGSFSQVDKVLIGLELRWWV